MLMKEKGIFIPFSFKIPFKNRKGYLKLRRLAVTFWDMDDTIKPFSGKDKYPIRKWITDFEDHTGWKELQKLICVKKCLKKITKLFMQSERQGSFL